MSRFVLPLLLLLSACHHRVASTELYLEGDRATSALRGHASPIVEAYLAFVEDDSVHRRDAAVRWLRDKPEELKAFEALAKEHAVENPDEAALSWLLMGHAWLYLSENGRRIPPPAYTDLQGAVVWAEVVARLIDPRFADLETAAIARFERCIELSHGRGRQASEAEYAISVIRAKRGYRPFVATPPPRPLPSLVDAE